MALVARPPDEMEKINYRSMGRGTGGVQMRLKKGRVSADATSRRAASLEVRSPAPATIPSRFETILYRGNCEARGFGAQTLRFGQPPRSSEVPGPGSHVGADNREPAQASIGARGTTAFASRTPRRNLGERAKPGPGAYEVTPLRDTPSTSSGPSSAFVTSGSVNPANFFARPAPGPGDYDADIPKGASAQVHLSRAARWPETAESDFPGPGEYDSGNKARHDDNLRVVDHRPARRRSLVSSPTPVPFDAPRDKSELMDIQENAPPAAPRMVCGAPIESTSITIASMSEAGKLRVATEVLATNPGEKLHSLVECGGKHPASPQNARPSSRGANRAEAPGPGAYDVTQAHIAAKAPKTFSTLGSSSFQEGLSSFPRSWKPTQPGPTDYDANPAALMPMPQRVCFSPNSRRFGDKVAPAPGPAWYTPRKPGASHSFHLNTKEMWV